jgi:hypothetical protein
MQVQEASRIPNKLDENRICPLNAIVETTSIENRDRKSVR